MTERRLDWGGARERLERVREALERASEPTLEQKEAILRRRAARLAQRPPSPDSLTEGESVMIFRIGNERYGVPVSRVVEVIPDPPCTPVPGAPPGVAGVIQVRGEIRPVCEPSRALGLPEAAERKAATVLLLRRGAREFGVRVDAVEELRTVGPEERKAPQGAPLAMWMTQDLVAVLNPDLLFDEEAQ